MLDARSSGAGGPWRVFQAASHPVLTHLIRPIPLDWLKVKNRPPEEDFLHPCWAGLEFVKLLLGQTCAPGRIPFFLFFD